MHFRPLFVVFTLVSFSLVTEAEDKPIIREINLKDVKLKAENKYPVPAIIESAEDLDKSKVFEDDASRKAVKKQIDFTKEKLVVAAWSGPSDMKLSAMVAKDKKELTVRLLVEGGENKDVKNQSFAVAIPKDAKTLNSVR